jgi:PAS domain-containing protein
MRQLQEFAGRSPVLRYGAALASVALALLLRMALDPLLADQLPFITFFFAIAAAALFCGLGPSVLCAGLGFVAAELLCVHRGHAWWIVTSLDLTLAVSYLLTSIVLVTVIHKRHMDRQCAIARRIDLEREVGERILAQQALSEARDELESRVSLKTAELSRALDARDRDQRRFQEVLEYMPVCVAMLTSEYRVSFANHLFREQFGENHGSQCFEATSGLDAPCALCPWCTQAPEPATGNASVPTAESTRFSPPRTRMPTGPTGPARSWK